MSIPNNQFDNRSDDDLIQTIREIRQESEELLQRMMSIINIGIDMSRALDFDEILDVVAKNAKWIIDFEYCSILIIDAFGQWESRTLIDKRAVQHDILMTESVFQDVISSNTGKILNDSQTTFLPEYPNKLIIPLSPKHEAIGTIHFASNKPFEPEDLQVGRFLGFQLASAIDKTNQLQVLANVQQQLAEYASELSTQNEEMDTYNHTIAHDLKSPLSVIPLKVGLVKMSEQNLKPRTLQHLEDISSRVKYIEEMINQLLILSKLRDETETMQLINVNEVVDRCITRFPEFEMDKIGIQIQPTMPQVIGHSQWLEEVFANLISNAIKYMGHDNDTPRIRISATVENQDAIFSVADNGIGIRQQDQGDLFAEFARLKDIQAERLGLRLSIVQRIIEHFGGRLGVKSGWGQGTTFWFTIPILTTERFKDITPD
jgi:signal transduction histidine kinase